MEDLIFMIFKTHPDEAINIKQVRTIYYALTGITKVRLPIIRDVINKLMAKGEINQTITDSYKLISKPNTDQTPIS